jgi:hypothetical protein
MEDKRPGAWQRISTRRRLDLPFFCLLLERDQGGGPHFGEPGVAPRRARTLVSLSAIAFSEAGLFYNLIPDVTATNNALIAHRCGKIKLRMQRQHTRAESYSRADSLLCQRRAGYLAGAGPDIDSGELVLAHIGDEPGELVEPAIDDAPRPAGKRRIAAAPVPGAISSISTEAPFSFADKAAQVAALPAPTTITSCSGRSIARSQLRALRDCFALLAMTAKNGCHCEKRSDEAISPEVGEKTDDR